MQKPTCGKMRMLMASQFNGVAGRSTLQFGVFLVEPVSHLFLFSISIVTDALGLALKR